MADSDLIDEMMSIKYKFSAKGSIQIESKDDMRSRGMSSPDRLDAAMYACLDLSKLMNSPYALSQPGDKLYMDANELDVQFPFYAKWSW
jgi:hypothetical protein